MDELTLSPKCCYWNWYPQRPALRVQPEERCHSRRSQDSLIENQMFVNKVALAEEVSETVKRISIA